MANVNILASGSITLARVNDGAQGVPGESQYLHIKYSNDGETFTENNGEELGAWIGILVDRNATDSTTFSDYTWKKFTDDVDAELADLRQTIYESNASILETSEGIIMTALESYVEKSAYEQYREKSESKFEQTSQSIELSFSTLSQSVEDINSSLQMTTNNTSKHFEFTENGLIIKAGNGEMQIIIDNDIISFVKNGQQFGWWDGVNFHTGNIIVDVNQRAQFGNFAFIPRSNGNLSFFKVGD